MTADEHLIQQHTQRVHVGRHRHTAARHLFRRRVFRRQGATGQRRRRVIAADAAGTDRNVQIAPGFDSLAHLTTQQTEGRNGAEPRLAAAGRKQEDEDADQHAKDYQQDQTAGIGNKLTERIHRTSSRSKLRAN